MPESLLPWKMEMINTLIIDDDSLFAESLAQELDELDDFSAQYINDGQGLPDLENDDFNLILIDLRLKDSSGLNLIEKVKKLWPESAVYMMTGFGTIASAVGAIKLGATDYLTKPITVEKVLSLVNTNSVETDDQGQEEPLSLDRVEREYIEHILVQEKGNITRAAEKLGLHRQSLQRKLRKWVPFK